MHKDVIIIFHVLVKVFHGSSQNFRIEGDILLGGLFPMHETEKSGMSFCKDTVQFARGIQRAEAMKYAIERLNMDTFPNHYPHNVLGVKVGALIKDTCGSPAYAQNQSLDFVMASLSRSVAGKYVYISDVNQKPEPFPAVIGASSSSVSIQVANLLGLFHVSQVSPASTGHDLSNKKEFPFFTRTVPPDKYQAAAMVDIVAYFKWTYVHIMSSEGAYGEKGIQMFREQSVLKNICISEDIQLKNKESLDIFFEKVNLDTKVNVIVLFTVLDDTTRILSEAEKYLKRPIIWIGPDAWGKQMSAMSSIAVGAITITLKADESRGFTQYLKERKPEVNDPNPWLLEYWNQQFFCTPPYDPARKFNSNCTGEENLVDSTFVQDDKVPFVISAVESVFYALRKTLSTACGSTNGVCENFFEAVDNGLFHSNLLNVSFYGFDDQSSQPTKFGFDENGDGKAVYKIYNLQEFEGKLSYQPLAVWDEEKKLIFNDNNVDPSKGFKFPAFQESIPTSRCSEPCSLGHQKIEHSVCCWACTPCAPNQRLNESGHCANCTLGWWPTADFKDCYKLQKTVIEWSSLWAVMPILLSCSGIAATSFVAFVLILHNQTPIVKASGRELCFMILSGCIFCYLNTFLLLAKPNSFVCGAQRILVGSSFAMLYAPLLTKTNRIYRIFQSPETFPSGLRWISPESQLVITSLLVAVQLFATIVWVSWEAPGTRLEYTFTMDKVILRCKTDEARFTISLLYNMLLILLCTVYAIKTRNIPENFNEAKFIGFAMYTTCIVWLSFVPLYFGLKTDFRIQISTLCVSISLSATVALFCLFGPKLFIILFKPEQNVRRIHGRGANPTRTRTPSKTSAKSPLSPNRTGKSEKNCGSNLRNGRNGAVSNITSNVQEERVERSKVVRKQELCEAEVERDARKTLNDSFRMIDSIEDHNSADVTGSVAVTDNHRRGVEVEPREEDEENGGGAIWDASKTCKGETGITCSSSEHDIQVSSL